MTLTRPGPRPDPADSWIKPEEIVGCPTEKELPEEFRYNIRRRKLDPEYTKPRKLFYGLGVDIQDFLDYHKRHQLPLPPPVERRAQVWDHIMDAVMDDLSAGCNFELRLILPLSPHYDYMISLYDSWYISVQELEDDEEEDVFRIIKERFGSPIATQKPRWFFSLCEGSGLVTTVT
ncbi:hypothetical protein BDP27DRAFT_1431586 [Rhodocollybia butyracea]|uniref:Uncharacterized protein n=1 Tax=Rhodocollybia butyracea TaxID=206335 RepID=A0A9P5P9F3_9AGAR|nr:hypothetical protein BDP27DRAFT_1431586 [Rhodocollybia butyracea]